MTDSKSMVELAQQELGASQKELASLLRVSEAQVSKWKRKNDPMSQKMHGRLLALLNVDSADPDGAIVAGSIANAKKWEAAFHVLANFANENSETGYDCSLLMDFENNGLASQTWSVLKRLGVNFEGCPPSFFDETSYLRDEKHEERALDENGYALNADGYAFLVESIYHSLTAVEGFFHVYISESIDQLDDAEFWIDFDESLFDLATAKISISGPAVPKFQEFRFRALRRSRSLISKAKQRCFAANIPIQNEYGYLVTMDIEELSAEVERHALGLDEGHLHPDIYMNELLVGMRVIHQVLPAILKKLDMEDEFALNTDDLSA